MANVLEVFNLNFLSKDVNAETDFVNLFSAHIYRAQNLQPNFIQKTFIFILLEQLWNTCLIQYKHDLLFYPEWKRKGIEYIKDITKDNEKRLLTLEEMEQTIVHNRGSTVLDSIAVINAIPKTWLYWISASKQTTGLEIVQVTIRKRDQYLKKRTGLSKLIVNKDIIRPCSVGFW